MSPTFRNMEPINMAAWRMVVHLLGACAYTHMYMRACDSVEPPGVILPIIMRHCYSVVFKIREKCGVTVVDRKGADVFAS